MKKIFILILFFAVAPEIFSQSCCGGSFYDIAVLSLDKKALFILGYTFDDYKGVWDQNGKWNKLTYTSWQMKPSFSSAYRFNNFLQAGISFPLVINRNVIPGLEPNGIGFGDITLSGRYEIFQEPSVFFSKRKSEEGINNPYLALTFGVTLPTGKSEQTAKTEAEILGKGFFITSLGVSAMKTIVKNKFQTAVDLNWQHSFSKTYSEYFGQTLPVSYKKQPGERFNYAVSFNYLISTWHAASVSVGGFFQGKYRIDGVAGEFSDENSLNFSASYTYYPDINIRITPSVKWFIPSDNIGKNAPGSVMLGINLVYYLENDD
jgi:hypothetical protein